MADDLRSRIETLIASTPYVIGKDCYMVKVSDLEAAIAAAPVPSPPAQPKAWECVCTHHYRAHDRNTFRCTEGGCECSGYVDGPATFALKPSPPVADSPTAFDMLAHLRRQREWSERTFGPGARMAGVVNHIRKELREIEADPSDVSEWIDVAILALDGAWRAGYQPQQIIGALVAKQTKNERRKWPDWRTAPTDEAIEHVKASAPSAPAAGHPDKDTL